MSNSVAQFTALASVAAASVGATYGVIGSPTGNPIRLFKFTNLTDADIIATYNPTMDQLIIPAGSFTLYDISTNRGHNTELRIAQNTQWYVKYATSPPTIKSIYLEQIYTVTGN
jgi:hypothetical protein